MIRLYSATADGLLPELCSLYIWQRRSYTSLWREKMPVLLQKRFYCTYSVQLTIHA